MEGYTTILIHKKTRDKLAKLKRYRRESYDETLERLFSAPAFASSASSESERVREALERVARFCDGPKRSFEEVEADIRRVEEMETQEARELYAQLHPPGVKGRKAGLQKD